MKRLLLLVSLFLTMLAFSGEPIEQMEAPMPIPELVKDDRTLPKVMPEPVPYRGPLPEVIGEPIKWIVNNADKWQGWSLTGYSWGGVTKETHNPWRFKVGVVNGEWEMSRMQQKEDLRQWNEFQDWERQIRKDPVFGISFTILF